MEKPDFTVEFKEYQELKLQVIIYIAHIEYTAVHSCSENYLLDFLAGMFTTQQALLMLLDCVSFDDRGCGWLCIIKDLKRSPLLPSRHVTTKCKPREKVCNIIIFRLITCTLYYCANVHSSQGLNLCACLKKMFLHIIILVYLDRWVIADTYTA